MVAKEVQLENGLRQVGGNELKVVSLVIEFCLIYFVLWMYDGKAKIVHLTECHLKSR